jgi:hypothetical protein
MAQIGGGLIASIGALGGLLYKGIGARIRKVEGVAATKADLEEFNRQREHIIELFRENKEIRKDMNGGFSAIREEMHTIHLDLIDRLGKL